MVDMDDQKGNCQFPTDVPEPTSEASPGVTLRDGTSLVCGAFSSCYAYNFEQWNWTRMGDYNLGASALGVKLHNGSFWIIG